VDLGGITSGGSSIDGQGRRKFSGLPQVAASMLAQRDNLVGDEMEIMALAKLHHLN
jgi:hypothetical protein